MLRLLSLAELPMPSSEMTTGTDPMRGMEHEAAPSAKRYSARKAARVPQLHHSGRPQRPRRAADSGHDYSCRQGDVVLVLPGELAKVNGEISDVNEDVADASEEAITTSLPGEEVADAAEDSFTPEQPCRISPVDRVVAGVSMSLSR